MMNELKPCPFCGGKAELSSERTFTRRGGLCGSQIEALEKVNELKRSGTVVNYSIQTKKFARVGMKEQMLKWTFIAELQGFVPRCCRTNCIGRTQTMFLSGSEAIEAWNRRVEKSPCDCCRYYPPSSMDGKPCTMCVAEGRVEDGK